MAVVESEMGGKENLRRNSASLFALSCLFSAFVVAGVDEEYGERWRFGVVDERRTGSSRRILSVEDRNLATAINEFGRELWLNAATGNESNAGRLFEEGSRG